MLDTSGTSAYAINGNGGDSDGESVASECESDMEGSMVSTAPFRKAARRELAKADMRKKPESSACQDCKACLAACLPVMKRCFNFCAVVLKIAVPIVLMFTALFTAYVGGFMLGGDAPQGQSPLMAITSLMLHSYSTKGHHHKGPCVLCCRAPC